MSFLVNRFGNGSRLFVGLTLIITFGYVYLCWQIADYVTKELLVVPGDYRWAVWLFVFLAAFNIISPLNTPEERGRDDNE